MSARRVHATFIAVEPIEGEERVGLRLRFRPERTRQIHERIEHAVDLGPDLSVAAVYGLGVVVRVLRAARIAPPAESTDLLGRPEVAQALLERALGAPLVLSIRPRTQLRFVAWTESGVEVVEDVAEVLEGSDAYYVKQRGGRFPVRVPRDTVVRRRTEAERWYEVLSIERPPRSGTGSSATTRGAA